MAKRVNNVSVAARTTYGGQLESVESLIRRFKRKCDKCDLMRDIRKHDYYVKPSVKKKLKHKYALQNMMRIMEKKAASSKVINENEK